MSTIRDDARAFKRGATHSTKIDAPDENGGTWAPVEQPTIPHFTLRTRGWGGTDDAPRVHYAPLPDVLRGAYDDDRCFAAYSAPEHPHRLTSTALDHAPVEMVLLCIDVDAPKGDDGKKAATTAWRATEAAKVGRLLDAHPGGFVYATPGGYRVVYRTRFELRDAAAWAARYLATLAYLRATFAIEGDEACSDWTRIFRAPHATRSDVQPTPLALPTIGDPEAIDYFVADLTPFLGATPRAAKRGRGNARAGRARQRLTESADPRPRTGLFAAWRREVLERARKSDGAILEIYGAHLTGKRSSANWLEARALDREDRKPSAGVCRAPHLPLVWNDFAAPRALSVFDYLVASRRCTNIGKAFEFVGDLVGLPPPPREELLREHLAADDAETLLTGEQAQALIADEVRAFTGLVPPIDPRARARALLLATSTGSRKTTTALGLVPLFVKAYPNVEIAYSAPTHRLNAKGEATITGALDRAVADGTLTESERPRVTRYSSALSVLKAEGITCIQEDAANALAAARLPVRQYLCASCDERSRCPASDAPAKARAAITLLSHERLPRHLHEIIEARRISAADGKTPPLFSDLLLIIDERPAATTSTVFDGGALLARVVLLDQGERVRPVLEAVVRGLEVISLRDDRPARVSLRQAFEAGAGDSAHLEALAELGGFVAWRRDVADDFASRVVALERARATQPGWAPDEYDRLGGAAMGEALVAMQAFVCAAHDADAPAFRLPLGKDTRTILTARTLLYVLLSRLGERARIIFLDATAYRDEVEAALKAPVREVRAWVRDRAPWTRKMLYASNAMVSRATPDGVPEPEKLRGITEAIAEQVKLHFGVLTPETRGLFVSSKLLDEDLQLDHAGKRAAAWVHPSLRDVLASIKPDFAHYYATEGLDDFEGCRFAVIYIDPRRNIAEVADAAAVLGLDADDYGRRLLNAQTLQVEGRLRCSIVEDGGLILYVGTVAPQSPLWTRNAVEVLRLEAAKRQGGMAGRSVAEALERLGVSAAQLAADLGVERSTVTRWLHAPDALLPAGRTDAVRAALAARGASPDGVARLHIRSRTREAASYAVTQHDEEAGTAATPVTLSPRTSTAAVPVEDEPAAPPLAAVYPLRRGPVRRLE